MFKLFVLLFDQVTKHTKTINQLRQVIKQQDHLIAVQKEALSMRDMWILKLREHIKHIEGSDVIRSMDDFANLRN